VVDHAPGMAAPWSAWAAAEIRIRLSAAKVIVSLIARRSFSRHSRG